MTFPTYLHGLVMGLKKQFNSFLMAGSNEIRPFLSIELVLVFATTARNELGVFVLF